MVSAFRTLVVKELRDLLKDKKILLGMILVPLLIFPLMGAAINISTESLKASTGSASFAVMDLDQGNFSQLATQYFSSIPNVTVKAVSPQPIDSALAELKSSNISSLVVIPQGFSENITERKVVSLQTYAEIRTFGAAESVRASIVENVVTSFGDYLTAYYIRTSAPGLSPETVMNPLVVNQSSYVRGAVIPVSSSQVSAIVFSQSFSLPFATFIVVIFAMQIASSAMAVEKEQKTLETLLTLPVSRFTTLAAKLVGSTIIAGLGAITSMIGFTYYTNSITGLSGGTTTARVEISPSLSFYAVLGILVFLTLAVATSLAIVISVFAEDVRSAQAIVGYLSLPVMLPAFLVIFGDFNSLPFAIKTVLLIIPFSYVAAYSSVGLTGDYTIALIGIVYLIAWIVGILYLTSKLFNSERILTARFSIRRRKQTPSSE